MNEQLVEICRKHINEGGRIVLLTHDFPDPDAISSAWALRYLLSRRDIEARICYSGLVDRSGTDKMVSMHGIIMTNSPEEFDEKDGIIFVDCQGGNGNVKVKGGTYLAAVDHHATGPSTPVEYQYKQVEITGACATLITEAFARMDEEIPKDIATCLLYGLKLDTMNFTRGVTERDIEVFKILHTTADRARVRYLETSKLEISDLKAFASAISSIQVFSDIGLTYIPFDCPDGLIGALADFMLDLDEVGVAVVFSRRSYGIKLSVRSILPYVHAGIFVHDVLEGLGSGGGHEMFAGGFIPNKSLEIYTEEELFKTLRNAFVREYGAQLMSGLE